MFAFEIFDNIDFFARFGQVFDYFEENIFTPTFLLNRSCFLASTAFKDFSWAPIPKTSIHIVLGEKLGRKNGSLEIWKKAIFWVLRQNRCPDTEFWSAPMEKTWKIQPKPKKLASFWKIVVYFLSNFRHIFNIF